MSVELKGFDELIKAIKDSPDKLQRKSVLTAQKLSNEVAGLARAGCPVDTGRTRNSIEAYTEVDGTTIEGGARSSYPVAIYLEMGTGPVGEASGHPMAGEMGVSYRPDGWIYQSERVAQLRGEEYESGVKGGYVYTEGQPARAFMYNAITAMEDDIAAAFNAALGEALQ